MTDTDGQVQTEQCQMSSIATVARGVDRVSTGIAALIPDRVEVRFDQIPGSDIMLLGPRVARALADVQRRERDQDTRMEEITLRHVGEAAVDEFALSFLKGGSTVGARHTLEEAGNFAHTVAELIDERRLDADPRRFNLAPDAPESVAKHRRKVGRPGTRAVHYSFESEYAVPSVIPGAQAWQTCEKKRRVHMYVLEHDDDAPWIINIHGFKQGDPSDFFTFRSGKTRQRFGVNVVHPVLPYHGERRHPTDPHLPDVDWAVNVFGLAQSVWDVRRVIRWIRQRSEAPIIVHGVSLGGYVAALLAGVCDDLTAAIVGLPVIDLPMIMRSHARRQPLSVAELALFELPAIDRLHGLVSPLAVDALVPERGRYIYSGRLDQISSPDQALALREHWGSPSIHWFDGGHVSGALWDGSVKQYVDAAIEESLATA